MPGPRTVEHRIGIWQDIQKRELVGAGTMAGSRDFAEIEVVIATGTQSATPVMANVPYL